MKVPKLRYRLILTLFDKVVGIAVEKPRKGLWMKIGHEEFDYEDGPKLEMLTTYIEVIAKKKRYEHLKIDHLGRIRIIDAEDYKGLDHLMKEGWY
jgi:hypothetical protein